MFLHNNTLSEYFRWRSERVFTFWNVWNKLKVLDSLKLIFWKSQKVALSLATTFFSAITILGTPVEYYSYGTMFTYFVICYLITIILAKVEKMKLQEKNSLDDF